jgi:cephalosporin hydroxylase
MIYNKTYINAVLQNLTELSEWIQIMQDHDVKSYLEIGSKYGGSLWRVANALPKATRLVAVDWPQADGHWYPSLNLLQGCADKLIKLGHNLKLILGDSTDQKTINRVHALSPFDAVFIDANHSLPFVKQDWKNYGMLANKLVAFHDIGSPSEFGKQPCQVPEFWNDIKNKYRHVEIRHDPEKYGIGVLWATATK